MLSRVANSVYWMSRYLERAEDTARLISVNTHLVLDTPRGMSPGWAPLVQITGSQDRFSAQFAEATERNVVRFLLTDERNGVSVNHALSCARENARTVRDVLPREVWEELNGLYLYAHDFAREGLSKNGRYDYVISIIRGVQQITGMIVGTMSHNMPYDFMVLGRNLERADMTLRILDVRSASLLTHEAELRPFENIQWMSVLKSLSSYQMYRQYVGVRVSRDRVLQFLLQDRDFPRAIHHCLVQVESALRDLPRHQEILSRIETTKRELLAQDVTQLESAALHSFIDQQELALGRIGDSIADAYFHYEIGG